MGTCLYAAAWKINSTPCSCSTSERRSASRISPSAAASSSSRVLFPEFVLDPKEVAFRLIECNQAGRSEAGHLAAQF